MISGHRRVLITQSNSLRNAADNLVKPALLHLTRNESVSSRQQKLTNGMTVLMLDIKVKVRVRIPDTFKELHATRSGDQHAELSLEKAEFVRFLFREVAREQLLKLGGKKQLHCCLFGLVGLAKAHEVQRGKQREYVTLKEIEGLKNI